MRVDSLVVVQDVKEKRNIHRNGNNLVFKIVNMWDLDWEVEIPHVQWEANKLAEALANHHFSLKE